MSLFRRDYRLLVGQPTISDPTIEDPDFIGDGSVISGLQLRFKVVKTADSKQNKSTFEIFNLSPETRAKFDLSKVDDTNNPAILFQVRYLSDEVDKGFRTLFSGSVANVITTIKGADRVTMVEAADGYVPLRQGRAAVSFPAGSNRLQVVKKLASLLDLPLGYIADNNILEESVYQTGITIDGSIRNALDEVCGAVDVNWSIQDDTFVIAASEYANDMKKYWISEKSGMIGSPYPTKAKKNRLTGSKTPDSGITVKTLLLPDLVPNRQVIVDSREFKVQTFKVDKVTHQGDFRGNNWTSKAELLRLDSD